jgi:hypothetical protein
MSRPGHPDPWVNPATPGLPQARCANPDCTPVYGVGRLVVAVTLTDGLCISCASRVDDDRHMTLRLDVA